MEMVKERVQKPIGQITGVFYQKLVGDYYSEHVMVYRMWKEAAVAEKLLELDRTLCAAVFRGYNDEVRSIQT